MESRAVENTGELQQRARVGSESLGALQLEVGLEDSDPRRSLTWPGRDSLDKLEGRTSMAGRSDGAVERAGKFAEASK